jgi:RND family efflux transporter MFP subunit
MQLARTGCKLVGLLFAVAVLAAVGCGDKNPNPVKTPPTIVQVAQPIEREVTDYQLFTARTQAVESVDVKARVTGYLTEIKFKDGDEIKKDQVLFVIDKRPYKNDLDLAEADVKYADASAKTAKDLYDIGLAVQKQEKGAISQQELARRRDSWEQTLAAIEQAKAKLDQAKLNYGWCEVTSPLDGRAARHLIDVGNIVTKDMSTLTNIVSLKPTWAYIEVDENTALRVQKLVKEGKFKSARTNAIPVQMALTDSKGFPFNGHVDYVGNQVDPNTGTIQVRAVFPNEDGLLSAGLFGRIKVPVGEEHKALLVNDQAVGTNQDQKFVLVVNDKNVVEYRPVDVGQLFNGLREVNRTLTVLESAPDGTQTSRQVEVLKPTDRIIVDGLQRVRPEMTVEWRPVDMETLMANPKSSEANPKSEIRNPKEEKQNP